MLDWRGAKEQQALCSIFPIEWSSGFKGSNKAECLDWTDRAIRPVISGGTDKCDIQEQAVSLTKLGKMIWQIINLLPGGTSTTSPPLADSIEKRVKQDDDYEEAIELGAKIILKASQVFTERMVQECQCKQK